MLNERIRKYSLERLSQLTDVQERTIRAYIAQGLIPSPVGKGRAAYYTEIHRKRLKVIKQLRDRYGLPLDQIRQHLMTAGESEDIQIVPLNVASPMLQSRADRGFSVQECVAEDSYAGKLPEDENVDLADTDYALPEALSEIGGGLELRGDSRLEQLVNALQQLVGLRSQSRSHRSEACQIVEITPDISLLVKGQYAPREVALFENLADGLRVALTRGLTLSPQKDDE